MRSFLWLLAPALPLAVGCNSIAGLSDLEEADCVGADCSAGGTGGVAGSGGTTSGAAGTAGKGGAAGGVGGAAGGGAGGASGVGGASGGGAGGTAGASGGGAGGAVGGTAGAGGGGAGGGGTAGAAGDAGTAGAAGDAGTAGSAGSAGGCAALTCEQLGRNCGDVDNGCGSTINCGTCEGKPGLDCGAVASRPNLCGCVPGTFSCVGDQLRRCADNGTATYLVADCPAGACDAAAGQCTSCTPGTDFCDGKQLKTCVDGATSTPKGAACSAALLCDPKTTGGGCDSCVESGYFCLGADLRQCRDTGKGSDLVATCGSAKLCEKGAFLGVCPTPVCEIGETRCSGQFNQICNDEQDGFTTLNDCFTAALCDKNNGCTQPACAVGEGQCEGNMKKVCNADRTGFDVTLCAQPTPVCELAGGVPTCTSRGPTLVEVGGFYIDSTEVTASQYQQFLSAGVPTQNNPESNAPAFCSWNTTYWEGIQDVTLTSGGPQRPAVQVDWCDAYAYCAWAGKRLCGRIGDPATPLTPSDSVDPAKSQWTFACGGAGKQAYPYSSTYIPSACNGTDAGNGATIDVGSLGQCLTGDAVFDLSGNVSEWEDACSGQSGENDLCRARGGAYNSAAAALMCSGPFTAGRKAKTNLVGFRCCAEP